ncbi:Hpt domain-containing protein [Flavicella sp.]|uniref:Hpt domain-containing protein n=1 Tax=Flavicella sp. TaxID=2957742 RepID=UPI002602AB67|nr:Hpt domain-containing protein [Flavicella sp.]MDG1805386.1 Hpt domain-containing protein [Flavicella sp.]MDG2280294.1 Hpt domain-containing protein [Flavicella sp.]
MEQPNLNYIQTLSGGDLDFEKKIIEILKQEFPEEKSVYENCITQENFKETAEIVHKIKHKMSIVGLEKSYELAVNYEKKLLNNSTELRGEFESVLETMQNYIENL